MDVVLVEGGRIGVEFFFEGVGGWREGWIE